MQKFKLNREEILKRFRYILNDADYAKVSNGLPPTLEVEGELLEDGTVEKHKCNLVCMSTDHKEEIKLPEKILIGDYSDYYVTSSKINDVIDFLHARLSK